MFVLNANVGRLFKSPPHNPPRSPFSSTEGIPSGKGEREILFKNT